ncbi:hypothetical protein OG548_10715 [Streptomyces sp. NBC_01356]|nr:hypothetical protein [Streptomyces sp. NBC_01356]
MDEPTETSIGTVIDAEAAMVVPRQRSQYRAWQQNMDEQRRAKARYL